MNYRKNNNCVHRATVTDLDGIIKGELSSRYQDLQAEASYGKGKRANIMSVSVGQKQRLAMAEDTHRRLELELRTAYTNPMQRVLQTGETYLDAEAVL